VDKYEFELAKEDRKIERIRLWTGLVKYGISWLAVVGAIYIIFAGLKPFIGQTPEAISAFASFLAKLNFGNITGYVLAGGFGLGWMLERKGKKRAIRKKGELQKSAENNDAYRSSSGLTSTGGTPEETNG